MCHRLGELVSAFVSAKLSEPGGSRRCCHASTAGDMPGSCGIGTAWRPRHAQPGASLHENVPIATPNGFIRHWIAPTPGFFSFPLVSLPLVEAYSPRQKAVTQMLSKTPSLHLKEWHEKTKHKHLHHHTRCRQQHSVMVGENGNKTTRRSEGLLLHRFQFPKCLQPPRRLHQQI